jgi:hypothetical protein
MDATAYSGTGNVTTSIVNQFGFKPDLVWTKARSTTYDHILFDSVRGTGPNAAIFSDSSVVEGTYSAYCNLSSFNSNGWTIGVTSGNNAMEASGQTFVAWQWQAGQGSNTTNTSGTITSTVSANATAGFSIVTFTAQSSGTATVGHGLGVAPSMIFWKSRNNAYDWAVYHVSVGNTAYLTLNSTAAATTSSTYFNNTSPTSSVFTTGTAFVNAGNYVAYCWAPVAGFSAFGSYTGNGSTDGPFIYLGFRPKFILWKKTNSATSAPWVIVDTARSPYNLATSYLLPNATDAEANVDLIDILSNGYKWRGTAAGGNNNGDSYIYAAFAENPFKYANAR